MVDERSLQAEIDASVVAAIPEPVAAMIDRMVADLRARRATPGIEVGEPAPDFTAPDHRGTAVRLADLLAEGPVVLSFYRGAWCPICNLELRALQAVLGDLEAAGARLVAISPQAPDPSLVERLDLGFVVCSDLDQSIAAAYRLRFPLSAELRDLYEQFGLPLTRENADGTWDLPVPATFVIDHRGVVRARHVDPDYRARMEPAAILAAVRDLAAPP